MFRFIKGPLFGNIILADEINRTPPKTQSALLEAMQERQMTVGGETYPLPNPFFVLATQNPIEQEGTYTLPEAQLDRFIFKIQLGYPSFENEIEICKRVTTEYAAETTPVLTGEQLIQMQGVVRKVPVAEHVYEFAVRLARMTRPEEGQLPDELQDMIQWGAGPRASIFLLLAAEAAGDLSQTLSPPPRRMWYTCSTAGAEARIIPTFNAEAAGVTTDQIVKTLINKLRPKQTQQGRTAVGSR